MRPISEALPLLQQPQKIFITTHHKPDGDAIGSMLGMFHYLRKKGHEVTAVTPSELPDFLGWMPGVPELLNYEAEPKPCDRALESADLLFCLDFNDFSRTKHLTAQLEQSPRPKLLLDHHLFPAPVWDYGMSMPGKSSTCEMVYDFINLSGDNELIDNDIAACLYTGLITDTGSFRFSSTTAETHLMAADLKQKGLDHSVIHDKVFDSWTLRRMQFIGYVLLEKMEIFHKYNAGLITLSRPDMKLFDITTGDTEGIVNYPLSISGISFAALITERADEVKLSFRSRGTFDVNAFARKYFSGGGHMNAAGGRSALSFSETVIRFKEILSDIHPR